MGEVKLIVSETSVFCARIEWALKLKGIEYETLKEDLQNKSPLLLKYNPVYKKVPVLVHGDNPISESLLILEYIDDTWRSHPLLPQDPYQRAMARFWAKFADEKCLYGAFDACWQEGEQKEKSIASAMESFAFLEELIKGKKYFNGDEVGYLDIVIGWIPLWLDAMEEVGGMKLLDPLKFPSLNDWVHSFDQISLIKDSSPSKDSILNYLNASVTFMRSAAANKS